MRTNALNALSSPPHKTQRFRGSGDSVTDGPDTAHRAPERTMFEVSGSMAILLPDQLRLSHSQTAVDHELRDVQHDGIQLLHLMGRLSEGTGSKHFIVLGRGNQNALAKADMNPAATPDPWMSRQHITVKWQNPTHRFPKGTYRILNGVVKAPEHIYLKQPAPAPVRFQWLREVLSLGFYCPPKYRVAKGKGVVIDPDLERSTPYARFVRSRNGIGLLKPGQSLPSAGNAHETLALNTNSANSNPFKETTQKWIYLPPGQSLKLGETVLTLPSHTS